MSAGSLLGAAPIALTVCVAIGYATSVQRAWASAGSGRIVRRSHVIWFALGIVTILVALAPPLDAVADRDLTAHMVQHVLLMAVAAPPLVLGAPMPVLLWAVPAGSRSRVQRWWRAVLRSSHARWGVWVGATLGVQTAVLLGWHTPVLYEAAVHHEALHAFEHLGFLATGVAFWWVLLSAHGARRGVGVLVSFAAAFPATILAAGMTLTRTTWYSSYPHLADQQIAGVVMWLIGGLAYVGAGIGLFASWVASSDRLSPVEWVASEAPRPVEVGEREA